MIKDDHVNPVGGDGVENIENTSKRTGKLTFMHKFRQNLISWKKLTSGQKRSVGVIVFLLLALPFGVFYTLNPRAPRLPYANSVTSPVTPSGSASPTPTPTPTTCRPGDTSRPCDDDIDIFDYNTLLEQFGQPPPHTADFSVPLDGDVDIFDYNILLTNFGS